MVGGRIEAGAPIAGAVSTDEEWAKAISAVFTTRQRLERNENGSSRLGRQERKSKLHTHNNTLHEITTWSCS